jgi:hypothetical protein
MAAFPLRSLMSTCIYCGDAASDRDHVVPVYYRSVRTYETDTVPACRDCNSAILSNRPLFTVEDRRAYVAGALRRRLAKTRSVEWTDEELADLGPALRTAVEADQLARRKLIQRLAYAEAA